MNSRKSLVTLGAVLGIALAVLFLQYLLFGRSSGPYPSYDDMVKWHSAIEKGDAGKAVSLSYRILKSSNYNGRGIPPDYQKVAYGIRLDKEYFRSGPDKYDFLRWESAVFTTNILRLQFRGDSPSADDLLKFIRKQVKFKPSADLKQQALAPAEIWRRGFGNTHELTRLFCEMAFQAGYEVQTVSLCDPRGEIIHILCELRKDVKVDTVDIRFGKVWSGRGFTELLKDKSMSAGIWPEEIEKCSGTFLFGIPAEPQDYKSANQYLWKFSSAMGFGNRGSFGHEPNERIESYLRYFPAEEDVSRFTYWRYPFIVMMAHISQ